MPWIAVDCGLPDQILPPLRLEVEPWPQRGPERNIEDALYEHLQRSGIDVKQQWRWHGMVPDLVAIFHDVRPMVAVVEVKAAVADRRAVAQIMRYVGALHEAVGQEYDVAGILAAPRLTARIEAPILFWPLDVVTE